MRFLFIAVALAVLVAGSTVYAAEEPVRLEKNRFLDKCKGAWAGQMLGVCYGARYEFKSNGKPIEGELHVWAPKDIKGAIGQDDCYVEMTFLKALEAHGLDISPEQAGHAFAETKYPLWHANRQGRENVRRGIMPPLSGHPHYNRHADDIDFQIEADLFGILCPGLPQESNRLCEIFGSIMNYGDGVYGGMFVAGMYTAAYFEDHDVPAVVKAGLECIPPASQYRLCIEDTMRWHDIHPDDWLATWHKIETKWQDDVDCSRGDAFNIDAKLNGAYIVVGLLYGEGDMMRTIEYATRCGQDADCNPSNAAGVLGCMKGYNALGPGLTGGIPKIEDKRFSHTEYSFKTLIPACQRVAESVIRRAGGRVEEDAYLIPRQCPRPPATLEQWVDQRALLDEPELSWEIHLWDPAWKVIACGSDMDPGYRAKEYGRESVLVLHPVSEDEPAAIEAQLAIPKNANVLTLDVASHRGRGDYILRVYLDGNLAEEARIETKGKWRTIEVDVSAFAGKTVTVRVENCANDWAFEAMYLDAITVR